MLNKLKLLSLHKYDYDKAVSGIRVWYDLKIGDEQFKTGYYKAFQKKEDMGDMENELRDHFAEGKLFIKAPTIEPGKYPVVLSPHATGIFAHESFGHKSEADWMIGDETMKAEWVIGKKVANEKVSIVDVGDDPCTSGYCPIDDEGNISEKTYLIKNGILTGRLHNEATAELLEEAVTGNARAINFEYEPIVRMTNTYFEAGDLSFDELIKPIKKGYFIFIPASP